MKKKKPRCKIGPLDPDPATSRDNRFHIFAGTAGNGKHNSVTTAAGLRREPGGRIF
ncbi:MAG: hypothetical protein ACRC2T_08340 [Thermoguttaceae bacterium]